MSATISDAIKRRAAPAIRNRRTRAVLHSLPQPSDWAGSDPQQVAAGIGNLASVLHRKGEYGEAERLSREALVILRQRLGEDYPRTIDMLGRLASALREKGDCRPPRQCTRRPSAAPRHHSARIICR
ncbi:MAG: tetratricopeptide repeat protein [Blastocatellia bacterium]